MKMPFNFWLQAFGIKRSISAEQFLQVFENYNHSLFPAQLIILLLVSALTANIFLLRKIR